MSSGNHFPPGDPGLGTAPPAEPEAAGRPPRRSFGTARSLLRMQPQANSPVELYLPVPARH
jgi:hypothetical protein